MLVTNVSIRGNKENTERTVVYARHLNNGSNLEEITEKIFSAHTLKDELSEIRLFSITRELSRTAAEALYEQLKNDAKFNKIDFELVEKGSSFIIAYGQRASLRNLPVMFSQGADSSRNWIKRQLNFPFSKIEKQDGEYTVSSQLTLEEFKGLPTYTLDTEFMFWEKEISLSGLSNSREQLVQFLERLEPGDYSRHSDSALVSAIEDHFNKNLRKAYKEQPLSIQIGIKDQEGFKVHYFEHLSGDNSTSKSVLAETETTIINHKSQNSVEMLADMQAFLDKRPPTILITQNGMSYDFRKLNEQTEKNKLKPFAIAGQKPVTEGICGFFRKVVIPSVYNIDLAPYSQNYFTTTIDNRFATIVSLILGRKITKQEGYDDITRLTIEQIIGNNDSADRMRRYACTDVLALNEVEDYIKTMVYFKSKLFKRGPEDICATSKRMLAKSAYECNLFEKTLSGLKWKKTKHDEYNDFVSSKVFEDFLSDEAKRILRKTPEKQICEAGLFYLAPFTGMFSERLRKNPIIKDIFNYIADKKIHDEESSTQNTLARFDLLSTIEEGYLLPMLFESIRIPDERTYIANHITPFSELIANFPPLNHNGNFYCFDKRTMENPEFKSALKRKGFKIAEGRLINFHNRSFALHDGISIYKKGVDTKGIHGFRTIAEKEFINGIIKKTFEEGDESALKYASEFINSLKTGSIEREKLVYFKKEVSRDYFDFSSYAQRQERIKVYIAFAMEKGKEFAKAKMPDGLGYKWIDLKEFVALPEKEVFSQENIEFMLNEYLGPECKNGSRSLSNGKIGQFIEPLLHKCGLPQNIAITLLENNQPEKIFANETPLLFT